VGLQGICACDQDQSTDHHEQHELIPHSHTLLAPRRATG
jgi:hypothetical protein